MKKRFYLTLLLSLFVYTRSAYAIFDLPAILQSLLEYKTELENKYKEIMKLKDDIEKRAKQGFAMASNCFTSIKDCDINGMTDLYNDATGALKKGYVVRMKEFPVMPNAEKLKEDMNDTSKNMADEYQTTVRNSYIYKKGGSKDLEKIRENRDNINSIVIDEIAMLFSKGATTRHSVQTEENGDEENKKYTTEFKEDNLDEILAAQNNVGMLTNSRLARIIELRAYMNSATATAEMTQHSVEADDKE